MAAANLTDNNSVSASSSANHSPRHSGQNTSSPKSRRPGPGRTVSPWSQIVRGESDTITAVPSSPTTAIVEPVSILSSSSASFSSPAVAEELVGESSESGNGKKPVWNKLSNGTAEGPVMGAETWPALSESTKAVIKNSSDSLKGLADGSAGGVWQGSGNPSPSPQKEVSNDASLSSNPTPSHPITSRQKSMRRNGASNSYSGPPQQSVLPGSVIDTVPNNPSRDQAQRTTFPSQSHNDHGYQQQRNSFRSRVGGSHPRGDSSHHQNHGSRRDHDRGNQDWNPHRNFNGQHQRGVPRFIRPPPMPPSTATFVSPPPMRPLSGPIPFPEYAPPMVYVAPPPPPEALRGVSFVTPMHPNMFFSAPDAQLYAQIVKQIDYYFSGDNLIKDTYLRKNMDEYGWVPIKLIAGFNKVSNLTDNIQLILEALQTSTVVEVQGDKLRRRNDWSRWIMPPSAQIPNVAGPLSPVKSSQDMLAAGVQGITLEKSINYSHEGLGDHGEAFQSRSYENSSSQMQPYGDDGTSQVNIKPGLDHSSSERS